MTAFPKAGQQWVLKPDGRLCSACSSKIWMHSVYGEAWVQRNGPDDDAVLACNISVFPRQHEEHAVQDMEDDSLVSDNTPPSKQQSQADPNTPKTLDPKTPEREEKPISKRLSYSPGMLLCPILHSSGTTHDTSCGCKFNSTPSLRGLICSWLILLATIRFITSKHRTCICATSHNKL